MKNNMEKYKKAILGDLSKLDMNDLVKLRKIINEKDWNKEDKWNYYTFSTCRIKGMFETDDDIYRDNEKIKEYATDLYEQYNDAIKDTSSVKDVALNVSEYFYYDYEEENIEELANEDRFMCSITVSQVIAHEDKANIEAMLLEKAPAEDIIEYIKKSKTNGLVNFDHYYMHFLDDIDAKLDFGYGIFDYNMFCKKLDELGLKMLIQGVDEFNLLENSYDNFLKTLCNNELAVLLLCDKRFEFDQFGNSIYTPIKKDKQKRR